MLFTPFKSIIPQGTMPQIGGGMPNPLSSHDAIINSLMNLGGKGGDEEKPGKSGTYQNQKQIQNQIQFDEDFNRRHNLMQGVGIATDKKVGDPVVPFRTLDGKPYVPQQMPASMIKNSVPDWVTELHMDDNWKMPYYNDGNDMVYVNKDFYNSPRFRKPNK